jgi:hypothetical protein
MGSLALRPGDSLAILVDGFVNGLQDAQFPSFLPFELRGLNFYPGDRGRDTGRPVPPAQTRTGAR